MPTRQRALFELDQIRLRLEKDGWLHEDVAAGDIVKAKAPNTDIWTGVVDIDQGDLFQVFKVDGTELSLQPLNKDKYTDDLIGADVVHFEQVKLAYPTSPKNLGKNWDGSPTTEAADIEQPTNTRIADLDLGFKEKDWIVQASQDLAAGIPDFAEDHDMWERALTSVKPKWEEYDEPYAVVVSAYKKMGGKIKGA